MNRFIFAGLVGLVCPFIAFAEATEAGIHTSDVVVTASRIPQPRDSLVADVSVITRDEIERSGQSTLVELLRNQPGIQIESNGGPGATANVHLRGTSSQAVVVLIDGMRMGSATNGTTAFNQIPPEQIERIEIVRGPASSLYGSDGVGGVIQIFTRQPEGKLNWGASAGYGSYNTQTAAANVGGKIENTQFSLNVSSLNTNGISSLNTNLGRDADADNYRNVTASGHLRQTWAEGQIVGLQFFHSDGSGEFDGNNFPAHQDMLQQVFAVTSDNKLNSWWTSHLKLGESMDDLHSEGSFGISDIRTKQRQYSWQNDLALPLGMLTLAYDRVEDRVKSNTVYSNNYRSNDGWLANYTLEYGPHAFSAGLRRDYNSQFGNHDTGNIGYGYKIDQFWRISGRYGTAFRAPTFNDLYWPFQNFGGGFSYQGNPNLKPETSRNREMTISYDQGHHRVSATGYYNKVDNLLVCCQGLAADFPANVGSATIKGVTLAYEGWFGNYHMRTSADFLSPKNDDTDKILARRAQRYGSLWLGWTHGDFELGTEIVTASKRYNDAANDIKLSGYTLLNLTAGYRLSPDWSIDARINNVFDREYALATTANTFAPNNPAYGTPGVNAFLTLRWQPQ